jgi:hypothetical protein
MTWQITGTEKTPVDRLGIANVSLLLHGDGTNGSTTIIDSSPSPKTVTAVGNAQISTAQSKFGGSSIAFDGTEDALSIPPSTNFDFANNSFTLECFIYLAGSGTRTIYSQRVGPSGGGVTLRIEDNNTLRAFTAGATLGDNIVSSSAISSSTWTHVAVTRTNQKYNLWIGGISNGVSGPNSLPLPAGIAPLIGQRPQSAEFFNGYIDDLRITKGVARYTANFTPPTAPFPDI